MISNTAMRYKFMPRCYIPGGPIFEKSEEELRKFLRLMKILGKTYDNADFRKILRNSLKKLRTT